MAYKGFTLTTNFSFVKGGTIYNGSRELYDNDGLYPTFNSQVLTNGQTRWQEPGDVASHPQLIFGGNSNSNKPSSRFLEDRSYLKLQNITLGYDFSKEQMGKLGIGDLRLYVSGDNLLTFTNFTGMDPAVGGLNGSTSTSYPMPQRFVFGLNISF